MVDYVNTNLPTDSVILMLFEARSFYFRPDIIQDVRNTNWPLLAKVLRSDECLRSMKVTYVLENQGTLNYLTKRGSIFSPVSLNALQQFKDQCLELVYETHVHRLYKVKMIDSAS